MAGASGTAFAVTSPATPLALTGGRGDAQFAALNQTGRPVRATAAGEPVGQAAARWFSLQPAVVELAPGASASFDVTVAVPAGTQPGTYSFQLLVAAQDNPDDDYAVSDPVTFEVAAGPKPKPIPWLLIGGAALGVLIVIGGVLAWLFTLGPLGPPVAEVAPARLDYGTLTSGSAYAPLKVTNTGHRDLVVDGFQTVGDPAFSMGKGNCSGQPIKSGDSCTVMVAFSPPQFTVPAAHHAGSVLVRTNAGSPIIVPTTGDALFLIFIVKG